MCFFQNLCGILLTQHIYCLSEKYLFVSHGFSVLHLELHLSLEQLLRFQSAFIDKYCRSVPSHSFLPQELWSRHILSLTAALTEQFVRDILLMCLPASSASDGGSDSGPSSVSIISLRPKSFVIHCILLFIHCFQKKE